MPVMNEVTKNDQKCQNDRFQKVPKSAKKRQKWQNVKNGHVTKNGHPGGSRPGVARPRGAKKGSFLAPLK